MAPTRSPLAVRPFAILIGVLAVGLAAIFGVLSALASTPGAVTIGPQAMEGNLQIHAGDNLRAGYDFTMPGSHPAAQVTVTNAQVALHVRCQNGTTPPAILIPLPTQNYNVPARSSAWFPSGDQSSPAVYQGSLSAPDLCTGGVMSGSPGAVFTATFTSTDTVDPVNVRFHYSDQTSGSWSATVRVTPGPVATPTPSPTVTGTGSPWPWS